MDLVLCYLAPKLSDGMAIILYMIIRMLFISFGTYSSKRSHLYVGTDMFFLHFILSSRCIENDRLSAD